MLAYFDAGLDMTTDIICLGIFDVGFDGSIVMDETLCMIARFIFNSLHLTAIFVFIVF